MALAACVTTNSSVPDVNGAAGSSDTGGATPGGSAGTSSSSAGTGGSGTAGASTGGNGTAGSGTSGGSTGGSGVGGTGTAGNGSAGISTSGGTGGGGTGGSATGGVGTAGAGSGGVAGMSGGGTAGIGAGGVGGGSNGGATSGEDEGADCTVANLPASGSLPTIAKLPDPFTKLDGTRMSTQAEWRCRREEILKQAEQYIYGTKPGTPTSVSGTVSNTNITVNVTDKGKSTSFSASVVLPGTGSGPYPAIVVLGGATFGAPLDPAVIKSEGIAIINYDPYALGKEGTPRNDKQGAFYDLAGNSSTTGLLVAWAWGVSRIIDVIEQSGGAILKADAVAVAGCSRFGKGAFATGIFDQRIALTMPIESGSGGVPIWRGIPGEGAQTPSSAYGEQPWLGDAFSSFTNKVTALPIDTHELVALVAPRGLFIMDNPFIANLGPKSAHVAALGGAEVFKALGAGDNITYYSNVQNGTHCSMRPEWSAPLRSNIRKFLTKTGSDPGVINASGSATGNLSTWRDWTTPVLN